MKSRITNQTGFTIVEIMIAIAILAILTALAMPSLQQFLARNELVGTSNGLISGINLARTEAVTRSTAVAICPSTDGASCSGGDWESGFLVFVDDDNNSNFNGGEELIRAESGYTNPAITIDGILAWTAASHSPQMAFWPPSVAAVISTSIMTLPPMAFAFPSIPAARSPAKRYEQA